MDIRCVTKLEQADECLDYGLLNDALRELVVMHRCAITSDCAYVDNCQGRVERVWKKAEASAGAAGLGALGFAGLGQKLAAE
jgi:hypothetical protein